MQYPVENSVGCIEYPLTKVIPNPVQIINVSTPVN